MRPATPIPLCADYDAARLRQAARESKDAGQTRRLLALAAIYDGASRTNRSIGSVTLQIVRDWVLNSTPRPRALIDRKAPAAADLDRRHRARWRRRSRMVRCRPSTAWCDGG